MITKSPVKIRYAGKIKMMMMITKSSVKNPLCWRDDDNDDDCNP